MFVLKYNRTFVELSDENDIEKNFLLNMSNGSYTGFYEAKKRFFYLSNQDGKVYAVTEFEVISREIREMIKCVNRSNGIYIFF